MIHVAMNFYTELFYVQTRRVLSIQGDLTLALAATFSRQRTAFSGRISRCKWEALSGECDHGYNFENKQEHDS